MMLVRSVATSQRQQRTSVYSIHREELETPSRTFETRKTSSNVRNSARRQSTFLISELLLEIAEDGLPFTKSLDGECGLHELSISSSLPSTKVNLIVGGKFFQTFEETLSVFPETLLGNSHSRERFFNIDKNAYQFERCPHSFDAILFYYQSRGILSKPLNIKRSEFIRELEFFQITKCIDRRQEREANFLKRRALEDEIPSSRKKKFLRDLLGLRRDSWGEKLCYLFYLFVIWISTFNICLETVPRFHAMAAWFYIDIAFCAIITLEYVLHVYVSKNRKSYLLSLSGFLDVCAILPTQCYIILYLTKKRERVFNFINFLRVSRIIKCFQASRGLRQVLKVLHACKECILLLLLSVTQCCLLFSSLVFTAEGRNENSKDDNSTFPTFLDSFWYAIITATGVGYGDFYPTTLAGRVIGCWLSIFGVILFCLPTSQLVYKFVELFYLPYIFTESISEKRKRFLIKRRDMFLGEMDVHSR